MTIADIEDSAGEKIDWSSIRTERDWKEAVLKPILTGRICGKISTVPPGTIRDLVTLAKPDDPDLQARLAACGDRLDKLEAAVAAVKAQRAAGGPPPEPIDRAQLIREVIAVCQRNAAGLLFANARP